MSQVNIIQFGERILSARKTDNYINATTLCPIGGISSQEWLSSEDGIISIDHFVETMLQSLEDKMNAIFTNRILSTIQGKAPIPAEKPLPTTITIWDQVYDLDEVRSKVKMFAISHEILQIENPDSPDDTRITTILWVHPFIAISIAHNISPRCGFTITRWIMGLSETRDTKRELMIIEKLVSTNEKLAGSVADQTARRATSRKRSASARLSPEEAISNVTLTKDETGIYKIHSHQSLSRNIIYEGEIIVKQYHLIKGLRPRVNKLRYVSKGPGSGFAMKCYSIALNEITEEQFLNILEIILTKELPTSQPKNNS